uniref:Artemin n=1 Tax=Chelonoidis abingdonii TaxID=106734 RepID=A0A8C0G908_CHEAB
ARGRNSGRGRLLLRTASSGPTLGPQQEGGPWRLPRAAFWGREKFKPAEHCCLTQPGEGNLPDPQRGAKSSPCRLRSLLLRVKDLALGYDSEETILFKYCSGSCPKARTNHDLTLSMLLQKSEIPALGDEKIVGDPCCRPTHYEDVAFLDNSHQWHEVEKLSASACSCVG